MSEREPLLSSKNLKLLRDPLNDSTPGTHTHPQLPNTSPVDNLNTLPRGSSATISNPRTPYSKSRPI